MRVHHNTGQLGVLDQSLVERMTREKESWSKMIVAASVPNKLMNVSLVNRECIYTLHTSGQRVLRQEREVQWITHRQRPHLLLYLFQFLLLAGSREQGCGIATSDPIHVDRGLK